MKYLLVFIVICVVCVNSDQKGMRLYEFLAKLKETIPFQIVEEYTPWHTIVEQAVFPVLDEVVKAVNFTLPVSIRQFVEGEVLPFMDDLFIPKFCDNGSQLTMCPDPDCPIRTCDNTFTATPECFSINLPFINPGCTWLTCRCPEDQVLDKELKCVNINECVTCKENQTEVCPDYQCTPRTCLNRDNPNVCEWDITYLPACYEKLQCACANGFFYDTVTEKCVHYEDCTRYWWNYTYAREAVESLQDVAVVTGEDQHGGDVWVMKAKWRHRILPGKLTVKNKRGYVANAGEEHPVCEISVLCALPDVLEWVPFKKGDAIPRNAVIGGEDENNVTQYIGLGRYKGFGTPGRVHDGVLYVSYYKEQRFENFKILCERKNY